jgi:hypothetical protein
MVDADILPQHGQIVLAVLQDRPQLEGELIALSGRYTVGARVRRVEIEGSTTTSHNKRLLNVKGLVVGGVRARELVARDRARVGF